MALVYLESGLSFDTATGKYYDAQGNVVAIGAPTDAGLFPTSGSVVDVMNDPWTRALQSVGLDSVSGQDVISLLTAALKLKTLNDTQKAYLQINLQRAQQGMGPISWESFGSGASVGVSLDSSTRSTILLIGAGVVGVLLVALSRRR
jgi:hypothetical protein